jgi:hypothetical protein
LFASKIPKCCRPQPPDAFRRRFHTTKTQNRHSVSPPRRIPDLRSVLRRHPEILEALGSIPLTNTSVNPARSTGPALLVGGWALAQLWLFWVAPLAGAVIGGFAYKWLGGDVKVSVARAAE